MVSQMRWVLLLEVEDLCKVRFNELEGPNWACKLALTQEGKGSLIAMVTTQYDMLITVMLMGVGTLSLQVRSMLQVRSIVVQLIHIHAHAALGTQLMYHIISINHIFHPA